ncbi:MAG: OmpH family outer membrane protein [Candidatus Omnitrophica bacterium]|nr:OmpH family outer membrane protein [Candidatus Omnitrophota bacterium]
MKKILVIIALISAIFCVQSKCFAEDLSIGYINLAKIFEGYKKVVDSNEKMDKVKNDVNMMLQDMKKMNEGFDTLSKEAQEERKNQMLSKQEEIRKMTVDIRKDEERILREILKDVENVSKELRKKKKLTYIIDDRLIIDGPKENDLTDEIMKMLNERYKGN